MKAKKLHRVVVLIALLLIVHTLPVFGRNFSLVIFPVSSGSDLTAQASVFADLLRVNLINSNRVLVLDRNLVEHTLADLGVHDPSGEEADTRLKEAARLLDSDLYLKGSLASLGPVPMVTIELVATHQGTSIYSGNYALDKDIRRTARRMAGEMLDALNTTAGIRLSDIRTLLEMGQFREAESLFRRYGVFSPQEADTGTVRSMLHQGLAEEAHRRAEEFRNLFLFDEALLEINRALSYAPDNAFYLQTVRAIQEEQTRFRETEIGEIIAVVENLVDERRFRVAQGLLEILYNRNANHENMRTLNEAVRRGLREEEHVRQANLAFFNRDYLEARLELREAILLNPENPDYPDFMDRIDQREKTLQESTLRWSSYRGEIFSFNPVSLFLDKKHLRPHPHVALAFGSWTYRNTDNLEESRLPLLAVEGGYEWKRLLPYLGSFSYMAPYLGYGFGGRIGTGVTEQEGVLVGDFRNLEARRIIITQVYGSGSAELMILSFLFRIGLEAGMGAGYDRLHVRKPQEDIDEINSEISFTLHGGYDLGLSWIVNSEFRIHGGWRYLFIHPFPNEGKEKHRHTFFNIGAAFKL